MSRTIAADSNLDFSSSSHLQPGQEFLPGYHLLGPLGSGGFGEVWKCEAPGGLHKAVKFVSGGLDIGGDAGPAEQESRAIHTIKAIRHPYLLSLERVERVGNELVIVMELADSNLDELFQQDREAGRPGIPRERLVSYLSEAAEVLDVMNVRHGLLHLDVKPQNLFLVGDHVKVGDFGLVDRLLKGGPGQASPARIGGFTPLYAAPELFLGSISPATDQYSLAIVYQKLLTGTSPFPGTNGRQLMMQHVQGTPNLDPLPRSDRAAVARALSKNPADRFPSCSDFVAALFAGIAQAESDKNALRSRTVRRQVATVLLAEDDPVSARLLQATLQKWGFKVVTVNNGQSAWDTLQQPDAPRLAILDWQMPGMDGVEVCSRLRALNSPEPTYVILLTSRDGMENKVIGLREGADEYLTKPFAPEELRARLHVGCRVVGVVPGPASK